MSTRLWPASLAATEGLANARAGRWLAVAVAATVAVLTGGIALANTLDVTALVRAERDWINAGGFAFVVEPGPSAHGAQSIDVRSCERLSAVSGIGGAFAVEVTQVAIEPASAPGTSAALAAVSPGIYQFFGRTPPKGADIVITPGVVDDTGLADGESTTFTSVLFDGSGARSQFRATTTFVGSPILADSLAGAYMLPNLTSGAAAYCYVRTDAAHVDDVAAYLGVALARDSSGSAIVHPRLSADTYGVDFATAYQHRLLGWAWAAVALTLAALWAIVQWTRRARAAIYATFGAPQRARLVTQFTEWAALSGIGAAWGWGLGMAFAIGSHADIRVAIVQTTGQVVAAWCAASLGVALLGLVPVGTLLDALKDRS